jgi:hypothetical protein
MEASNDARVFGYADLLDLLGGPDEERLVPYGLTDIAVTFEPDPSVLRALTKPKSGSYPVAGSAGGGSGGPMTGAIRSLM